MTITKAYAVISTRDLDQARRGVEVPQAQTVPSGQLWIAMLTDPDGNTVALAQETAMRLVITQNITLDGVIEVTEDTGDWFTPADAGAETADLNDTLRQMMSEEDAQLHGRATFEAMRGFWPNQSDDTTGVTHHLNRVHKLVVSTTMDDPRWENSSVLRGDLVDEVRSLKELPGANMGVTGSISVCPALMRAGLVDEYRLLLYPVVVGTGRRLFDGNLGDHRDLELIDSTAFTSGVVLLRYRPA